jgi:acyl-CoA thioesterase
MRRIGAGGEGRGASDRNQIDGGERAAEVSVSSIGGGPRIGDGAIGALEVTVNSSGTRPRTGGGAIGAAGVTGARAMFAADTASRAAGIDLVASGPGSAEVAMTVRPDMANGHGIAHGGYVFLLADTAFACACNEEGSVTVAAGADITFLAPARTGDRLTAVATLRSRRGRSGIYDVTVTRAGPDASEVIAEFRGRSRSLPAPDPGAGSTG